MPPTLPPKATASLKAYIDTYTSGDKPILPGAIVHITNAQNETVFSHASGGLPTSPPTPQTVFTIHSVTKVIGAIGFLQLVERGLVSLDDVSLIPKYLPELAEKKVLTGSTTNPDGTKSYNFEDRKGDITPRMLLNHTYGGGHTFFNTLLNTYAETVSSKPWDTRNEATDFWAALQDSPLLWQPGTHTNYGQGLDWIAVLMERVTKRGLDEVLSEGVFKVLGLSGTGFEGQYGGSVADGEEGAKRFWPRTVKTPDGYIALDPPSLTQTTNADAYPHGTHHVHPLGTGLVSSAADLSRILSLLLPQNAGVDPVSGTRVLSAESVRQITSPQLPEKLRNSSRDVPTAVAAIIPADLMGKGKDPEGSFGLGCGVQGADRVLADGLKGKTKGSVYW
jgi:CubicO group peptidase (beta-lactamase class C family)